MSIKSELLEILACPKCKQTVEMDDSGEWLNCPACRLRFPVRDDIPVMLIDEALPSQKVQGE